MSCFLGLYTNLEKMLIFGLCYVLLFKKFSGRIFFFLHSFKFHAFLSEHLIYNDFHVLAMTKGTYLCWTKMHCTGTSSKLVTYNDRKLFVNFDRLKTTSIFPSHGKLTYKSDLHFLFYRFWRTETNPTMKVL